MFVNRHCKPFILRYLSCPSPVLAFMMYIHVQYLHSRRSSPLSPAHRHRLSRRPTSDSFFFSLLSSTPVVFSFVVMVTRHSKNTYAHCFTHISCSLHFQFSPLPVCRYCLPPLFSPCLFGLGLHFLYSARIQTWIEMKNGLCGWSDSLL